MLSPTDDPERQSDAPSHDAVAPRSTAFARALALAREVDSLLAQPDAHDPREVDRARILRALALAMLDELEALGEPRPR